MFLHLHSFRAKRENTDFSIADEGSPATQIAPAGISLACVTWDEAEQLSSLSHSPLLLAMQLKESGYI